MDLDGRGESGNFTPLVIIITVFVVKGHVAEDVRVFVAVAQNT